MNFLSMNELTPGMQLEFSYKYLYDSWVYQKGYALHDFDLKLLDNLGYNGLYVEHDIPDTENLKASVIAEIDSVLKHSIFADEYGILEPLYKCKIKDKSTMQALMCLVKFDTYTFYHSLNVANLAALLGMSMQFVWSDVYDLFQAGLCHDLGKSLMPVETLNKPRRLHADEFEIVKKHPMLSYYLASQFNSPDVCRLIKQHHENCLGTGYPMGICVTDKRVSILSVADVFDALTAKRVYKQAKSISAAMDIIEAQQDFYGTECVDTLKNLIERSALYAKEER